jgi:hypothetical protein
LSQLFFEKIWDQFALAKPVGIVQHVSAMRHADIHRSSRSRRLGRLRDNPISSCDITLICVTMKYKTMLRLAAINAHDVVGVSKRRATNGGINHTPENHGEFQKPERKAVAALRELKNSRKLIFEYAEREFHRSMTSLSCDMT